MPENEHMKLANILYQRLSKYVQVGFNALFNSPPVGLKWAPSPVLPTVCHYTVKALKS